MVNDAEPNGSRANSEEMLSDEQRKKAATQESEIDKSDGFEVTVLPRISEDRIQEEFIVFNEADRDHLYRAEEAIKYLQAIPKDMLAAEEIKTIDYLADLVEKYRKRLPGMAEAKKSSDLIQERIAQSHKLSKQEVVSGEILERQFKEYLELSKSDVISLAESHLATYYSISAAEQACEENQKQVGVIVFDNHVDTGFQPDPWKGNIFKLLWDENKIKGAAFFRTFDRPGKVYYGVEEARELPNDQEATQDRAERVKAYMAQAIENLLEQGIGNLLVSIDIDLLRTKEIGYTAMEYTPANAIGYLSSYDFSKYPDPEEMDLEDISKLMAHFISFGSQDISGINRQYSPLRNTDLFDSPGVHLSELGTALESVFFECERLGIKLGLELKGGGRYMGDIVELSGYDYKGHTTRAVSALVNKIESLASRLRKSDKEPDIAA